MSNYTNENLISASVQSGVRAIKIGNKIFVGLDNVNIVSPISDDPVTPASSSNINLVQITKYVPYRESFTAIYSFDVSGFGTNAYDEDLSDWNGTYTVTSSTSGLQGINREYQKGNEDKFLKGFVEDYGGGELYTYWGFCQSNTTYYSNCKVFIEANNPQNGGWHDSSWDSSFSLTLIENTTTYPTVNQELSGNIVTNYTNGIYTYGNLNSYETFDVEPKVGQIFASAGDDLFGNAIDYRGYFGSEVTSATIAYLPLYILPKNGDKDQSSHKNYITLNYDNFRVENGPFRESLYTYPSGPTPGGLVLHLTNSYNLNLPWTVEMYAKFYRPDAPNLFNFGDVQLVSDSTVKLIVHGSYPQNLPTPSYDGKTWYHLAVVHTGSSITLYFNGVAGDSIDTSNIDLGTNVNSINIATNGESYYNFVGNICEFLVSDYAKYTENFNPQGI